MPDMNFEQHLLELENIIKQLENTDSSLDKTLELYEQGVKIAKKCNEMLDKAEQKIKILSKTADGLAEIPFEDDGE